MEPLNCSVKIVETGPAIAVIISLRRFYDLRVPQPFYLTIEQCCLDRAAQINFSGGDVGMQPVFPRALLMERTKQASLGNVEG